MNFVYESALMTTNVVLNHSFTTQVLRNLARGKALMITFSTDVGDDKDKPGSNEMYIPQASLTDDGNDTEVDFSVTLGGQKINSVPCWPAGGG